MSKCCSQAKKPTLLIHVACCHCSACSGANASYSSRLLDVWHSRHMQRCQKPSTTHHQAHPCSLGSYAAHLLMMPHHSNLQVAPMQAPWAVGALPQPHPHPSLPRILELVIIESASPQCCISAQFSRYNAIQPNFTIASQPDLYTSSRIRTSTFKSQNKVQIVSQSVLLVLPVLDSKNPALDVRYGSPILVPLVQGGVHHARPQRSDHNF
jgi:hypothetical protein